MEQLDGSTDAAGVVGEDQSFEKVFGEIQWCSLLARCFRLSMFSFPRTSTFASTRDHASVLFSLQSLQRLVPPDGKGGVFCLHCAPD